MRFGIVGTGLISEWFVAACQRAGGVSAGVYSRDSARGRDFATRHGLAFVATTMDELAGSNDIDAVYVASPIGVHHAHVTAALARGKQVLCEKTLATSPEEVSELFDLAAAQGRVLLEAVRPVYDPAYRVIASALGRLGTLRHAHFEKCQYSSRYPAFLRGETLSAFELASGNSALRDIGVYCLHPSLTLFGAPISVTGADYYLKNGFEAGGSLLLDYGAMSVTCTYSKVTRSVTRSVIEGESGSLSIDSVAEPAEVCFTGVDGRKESILSGPPKLPSETLHHPIEEFLRLCAAGSIHHPYRAQSMMAEEIMSSFLLAERGSVAAGWQGQSVREDQQR